MTGWLWLWVITPPILSRLSEFEERFRFYEAKELQWQAEKEQFLNRIAELEDTNKNLEEALKNKSDGAENLSTLCRLALGLMNKVKGKRTIPNLMFQLALDPEERTKVIKQICEQN